MKAKPGERNRAIQLKKEGFSLSEISESLNVSKSSASSWVRDVQLSEDAKLKIQNKRILGRDRAAQTNKSRTELKLENASGYAKEILAGVIINPDTARLLCALLYWCEGVKIRRTNTFGFTNSDPNLMREFMRLFREGFDVDESKLRLTLHLHEYHDEEAQLQFWSNVTNIPLSQCHRPYKKPHTATRIREGYQGCVTVRYFDVELARRLEAIAIVFLQKIANQGL
jgi:hypothetical protein